ncbi:MAG: hypothetical protein P8X46_02190, partial [Nitrospirales bacterium]
HFNRKIGRTVSKARNPARCDVSYLVFCKGLGLLGLKQKPFYSRQVAENYDRYPAFGGLS